MYLCKGWIGCCTRPCVLKRLVVLKTKTCHMSAERDRKRDQHTHVRQQKDVGMPGQFLCNETAKGGTCRGHKDVSRFRGRVNMSSATAPKRVMAGHLFQAAVAGGAVAEKHVLCKGPVDRILLNRSGVMLDRLCKVLLLKGLVAVELGLQSRSQVRAGRAACPHLVRACCTLSPPSNVEETQIQTTTISPERTKDVAHTPARKDPQARWKPLALKQTFCQFFPCRHAPKQISPLLPWPPCGVRSSAHDLEGKKWTNLQHHHRTQPDPISPGGGLVYLISHGFSRFFQDIRQGKGAGTGLFERARPRNSDLRAPNVFTGIWSAELGERVSFIAV